MPNVKVIKINWNVALIKEDPDIKIFYFGQIWTSCCSSTCGRGLSTGPPNLFRAQHSTRFCRLCGYIWKVNIQEWSVKERGIVNNVTENELEDDTSHFFQDSWLWLWLLAFIRWLWLHITKGYVPYTYSTYICHFEPKKYHLKSSVTRIISWWLLTLTLLSKISLTSQESWLLIRVILKWTDTDNDSRIDKCWLCNFSPTHNL